MLIAGTGDGAYRVTGLDESANADVAKVLDAPRVERVRQFAAVDDVFAATKEGLYHFKDGTNWTNLRVPEETVYAVSVSPTGERLYAVLVRPTSTRPHSPRTNSRTRLSYSGANSRGSVPSPPATTGVFRDTITSPRSGTSAPIRCRRNESSLASNRGGVHVSDDAEETWDERKDRVHDDVHDIYVDGDGVYMAATGVGLYLTEDVGTSWARLDENVDQRYFRTAYRHEGVLYTSAACVPPNRWDDDDADPAFFVCLDGETLEAVEPPRPEEVSVGWATVDGTLVGVTHRGKLFREHGDGWTVVGEVPTPYTLYGNYCNLTWFDGG